MQARLVICTDSWRLACNVKVCLPHQTERSWLNSLPGKFRKPRLCKELISEDTTTAYQSAPALSVVCCLIASCAKVRKTGRACLPSHSLTWTICSGYSTKITIIDTISVNSDHTRPVQNQRMWEFTVKWQRHVLAHGYGMLRATMEIYIRLPRR